MSLEAKVISSVCTNKDMAAANVAGIDNCFVAYKDVWESLKDYWHRYGSVPDASVLEEKHRDLELPAVDGSTKYYIDELRNEHLRVQLKNLLVNAGNGLGELPSRQVYEKLQQALVRIGRETSTIADIDITEFEDAAEHYEELAERNEGDSTSPGILTGIRPWDISYPTGLAPGHLAIVIGWSGRGKTWLASYIAARAWLSGYSPMIVSLEMSPAQMRDRIYTILASGVFRNSDMARGSIDVEAFRKWGQRELSDKHGFHVIAQETATGITPMMVQGKIDLHRPDLVIVDYLQLFDSDEKVRNETEKVRSLSRAFKLMAVQNSLPLIALSQATQSDTSDISQPPLISEAAWSRGIEHDADLAVAAHKDPDSDYMEVIARKNRHGPLFAFGLEWDLDRGIVTPVTPDDR